MSPMRKEFLQTIAKWSIQEWDGAFWPRDKEATLSLFEAVGLERLDLVQNAVKLGAKINARRVGCPGIGWRKNPLEIALKLLSMDENDCSCDPTFDSDGITFITNGIVEFLIDSGATTISSPSTFFWTKKWERHPASEALESMHFNKMVKIGGFRAFLYYGYDHNFRKIINKSPYVVTSVVAQHFKYDPYYAHETHSWLHRAILHDRFDVVKLLASPKHKVALNIPGSSSTCGIAASHFFSNNYSEDFDKNQRNFSILFEHL